MLFRSWSVAFLIILGTFIVAKTIYWLSGNIIKKITKKTKSKLDDLIIDKIEEPVILALVLGGIWYAVSYLNLSEGFANFADKAYKRSEPRSDIVRYCSLLKTNKTKISR